MIDYSLFTQKVKKIALVKPNYQPNFTGKRPAINFSENPTDYIGLDDPYYGTAFHTNFIPEFNQYFCVLDIDDYKESEFNILDAIPKEALNTHSVKSGSGGLHLYYLSETPRSIKQNNEVPLDLKGLTVTGEQNNKYGGLVVANFSYKFNKPLYESTGIFQYSKKFYTHDTKPILELNFDDLVSTIYKELGVNYEKCTKVDSISYNPKDFIGNADLEKIYSIIRKIYLKYPNEKHHVSFKINCRLRMLTDEERNTLAEMVINEFGDSFNDIENFRREFLKR